MSVRVGQTETKIDIKDAVRLRALERNMDWLLNWLDKRRQWRLEYCIEAGNLVMRVTSYGGVPITIRGTDLVSVTDRLIETLYIHNLT